MTRNFFFFFPLLADVFFLLQAIQASLSLNHLKSDIFFWNGTVNVCGYIKQPLTLYFLFIDTTLWSKSNITLC